jgi:hypothetical protein
MLVLFVSRNTTVITFHDIIEKEVNTNMIASQIVTRPIVPFPKIVLTTAIRVREFKNSYISGFKVLKNPYKSCELHVIVTSLWLHFFSTTGLNKE